MSPLDNFKLNFECQVCLNSLNNEVVTLNCENQHKMCLECAIEIFGAIKDGQVSKGGMCPVRCAKPVSSYVKDTFIPYLVKKISDSILPILDDLRCPRCLDYLENAVVTLNCSLQHKMCLICARALFKQISKNKIPKGKACPRGCKEDITDYTVETHIQTIAKEAKEIFQKLPKVQVEKPLDDEEIKRIKNDNHWKYMQHRMEMMEKEGVHPATVFYLSYKKPWLFEPPVW